jgi:hypothetical protein
MGDEADYFANWMWVQQGGGILPNQVNAVHKILNRLRNGDLIRVLYYAEPDVALKALKILKERFVDDLEAFEQQKMERDPDASAWH